MLAQRRELFRVRQGVQFEREAPGEAAAQIFAQRELRRCHIAAGNEGARACAHAVVQVEQIDLIACRQILHIVHGDHIVDCDPILLRHAAARCCAQIQPVAAARSLGEAAQQVRTAAARLAPQEDEAFPERAARNIAQRLQRRAVAAGHKVVQSRRRWRRQLQEQLLHHFLYRLLLRYWAPKWRRPTSSAALAGSASNTPKKPKIWPKASNAKITATGCRPMRLPTRNGVTSVPSSVWPMPNTIHTGTTPPMLGNCIRATTVASSKPVSMPT